MPDSFKQTRSYTLDTRVIQVLKEMSHLKSRPMSEILEGLIVDGANRIYGQRRGPKYAPIRDMIMNTKQQRLDL